jgi:hypothetical protein
MGTSDNTAFGFLEGNKGVAFLVLFDIEGSDLHIHI